MDEAKYKERLEQNKKERDVIIKEHDIECALSRGILLKNLFMWSSWKVRSWTNIDTHGRIKLHCIDAVDFPQFKQVLREATGTGIAFWVSDYTCIYADLDILNIFYMESYRSSDFKKVLTDCKIKIKKINPDHLLPWTAIFLEE